ncbi:MAG TPA: homoserine kinase [bacterium]|nr:homoserine kinase [bacterium]
MINKIKISVPACIGNIGSGFDCIGVSVKLFNEFIFEKCGGDFLPASEPMIGKDDKNLCVRVFQETCSIYGAKPPFFRVRIKNNIPPGKGLGSSGTEVIAGAIAGMLVSNIIIEPMEILRIGKKFEGHLDDIAASLFGGLVIVGQDNGQPVWKKIDIPENINAVFFISEKPYETKKARNILPRQVSLSDAVYNISRACFLQYGFLEKNKEFLRIGTQDRLHQIYRKKLYPHFEPLYKSALKTGAAGCCLSGAGPSVVAFCFGNSSGIVHGWEQLIKNKRMKGEIKIFTLGGETIWTTIDTDQTRRIYTC